MPCSYFFENKLYNMYVVYKQINRTKVIKAVPREEFIKT